MAFPRIFENLIQNLLARAAREKLSKICWSSENLLASSQGSEWQALKNRPDLIGTTDENFFQGPALDRERRNLCRMQLPNTFIPLIRQTNALPNEFSKKIPRFAIIVCATGGKICPKFAAPAQNMHIKICAETIKILGKANVSRRDIHT